LLSLFCYISNSSLFTYVLVIEKNQTKYWYLTLSEKTTISNAKYLFSVHHRLTDTITNFILNDVSIHKERYNQFQIDESDYDFYTGEYEYKVYAQTSAVNTNPNLADELVESGILKVNEVQLLEVFYEPT
jgi:hypothetical protein